MQMMAPDDWRTPTFRQNMISKIEEAIQQCGAQMNASDLENQLFSKARHKEEYMSLVTRIIMHIKDKGSKKHGVGPGVMGQPNQPNQPGGQLGGGMGGPQGNMGMMGQMNPMNSMNQMGVNVMGQQGMVHQMQQSQLVQQMQQPGMNQPPGQLIGGIPQQQSNQQNQQQQQHQLQQQGQAQMMGQNPITLGMNQNPIQISQMQHIQNAQMGSPAQMQQQQQQQQVQMQNVQMQQALMQGNQQQIMMQQGNQQQVMMQGNQTPQGMMAGPGGQPQMMMQGNTPQQQQMLQATSQAQGVMQGGPQSQQQQGMMQGGPQQQQQQQQPPMLPGPPQQPQPGNQQQQQMMSVRGIPNPQMVGNRLMTSQPNVSNTLTALAQQHAQQQRKQQQRPMVSNAMGIPRSSEHGPNYSLNRLYYGSNIPQQVDNVPVGVQFSGVPQGGQMQQRPVGPFVPPGAGQGMGSPSPGGLNAPSHMSQPQTPQQQQQQQQAGFSTPPQNMMHRPPAPGVGGLSPYPNQVNVPSPGTNLNTPMQMAATPSPRNAEDQACFEKIKELRKYIDLLQRMIAKIGNEDMEKSSKMKRLLEILTNSNQRVSMDILLKCESALKKMERHDTATSALSSSSSVPTPQPKDQTSPFQQIQDAVLGSLKNGSSSHTYLRTFRQSVEALSGQPFATLSPEPVEPEPDTYYENELSLDIPGVLRRELKIVDNRFKVKVMKNRNSALSVIVLVSLMDPNLPRVPPLKIFVPPLYPDESPSVLDQRTRHGSEFLSSAARTLRSRILNLPHRFTVLELLRCWEMSVRQCSNPNYKATAESRRRVSQGLALSFLPHIP